MNNDRPLYDLFLDRVKATPDGIAVHHRGQDCTYAKIAELADSLAAWLESEGLAPGDRVALLLPNSSQYVACYLGILRVGGVVVALNPDTTARELYHTLGDALPRVVITGKVAVVADVLGADGARGGGEDGPDGQVLEEQGLLVAHGRSVPGDRPSGS